MEVQWNQRAVTIPLLDPPKNPQIKKHHTMHYLLYRKMTISTKCATLDKTNLHPGELFHTEFAL